MPDKIGSKNEADEEPSSDEIQPLLIGPTEPASAAQIIKPEYVIDYNSADFAIINLDENENDDPSPSTSKQLQLVPKLSTPKVGSFVRNLLSPNRSKGFHPIIPQKREGESPDVGKGKNDDDEGSPANQQKASGRDTSEAVITVSAGTGADDDQNHNKKGNPPYEARRKSGGEDGDKDDDEDPEEIHLVYQIMNCSRHVHPVSPRLRVARLRSQFLGKVLGVKAVQWLFFVLFTTVVRNSTPCTDISFLTTPHFTYFFMLTYFLSVIGARACPYGERFWGGLATILVQIVCLCYIFAQILLASEGYILPSIVYTIAISNITLALVCMLTQADVSENSPIYSKVLGTVLAAASLGMLLAVVVYPPDHIGSWVKKLTAMTMLNLMVSETFVLTEVSDVHFVFRGYRFPISDDDWLIVAASLF